MRCMRVRRGALGYGSALHHEVCERVMGIRLACAGPFLPVPRHSLISAVPTCLSLHRTLNQLNSSKRVAYEQLISAGTSAAQAASNEAEGPFISFHDEQPFESCVVAASSAQPEAAQPPAPSAEGAVECNHAETGMASVQDRIPVAGEGWSTCRSAMALIASPPTSDDTAAATVAQSVSASSRGPLAYLTGAWKALAGTFSSSSEAQQHCHSGRGGEPAIVGGGVGDGSGSGSAPPTDTMSKAFGLHSVDLSGAPHSTHEHIRARDETFDQFVRSERLILAQRKHGLGKTARAATRDTTESGTQDDTDGASRQAVHLTPPGGGAWHAGNSSTGAGGLEAQLDRAAVAPVAEMPPAPIAEVSFTASRTDAVTLVHMALTSHLRDSKAAANRLRLEYSPGNGRAKWTCRLVDTATGEVFEGLDVRKAGAKAEAYQKRWMSWQSAILHGHAPESTPNSESMFQRAEHNPRLEFQVANAARVHSDDAIS